MFLDIVHMDNGFILRAHDVSGKSTLIFILFSLSPLSFLTCRQARIEVSCLARKSFVAGLGRENSMSSSSRYKKFLVMLTGASQ